MNTIVAELKEKPASLTEFQRWTYQAHQEIDGGEGDPRGSLACAALGICGELGELLEPDADELLEAGDVLSYVFLATAVLGYDVSAWMNEAHLDQPELCADTYYQSNAVYPRQEIVQDAVRHALAFAEDIKKHVFQGKPVNESAAWRLMMIVHRIAALLGTAGCSVRQVLIANTIKIEHRYFPTRPSSEWRSLVE